MRWDDLRTFLAIARAGSMSAAQRELGVNLSTVYRRLDALEEDIAARLFDRDGAGYSLTPAGREALEHATRVEEEVLALERAVSGHDQHPAGVVTFTLPESLMPLVGPLLLDFRDAFPRVVIQAELGDRMFDLDRLEADVALRPSPNPPESAVGRHVATVAWAGYVAVETAGGDTSQLPWLTYSDALAGLGASRWWQKHHASDPVLLQVSSVPALACLLRHSRGRGLLPCFVGDLDPELTRFCAPRREWQSELWLLIHADLRRNARVRAFVDFLFPRLQQLGPAFVGDGLATTPRAAAPAR